MTTKRLPKRFPCVHCAKVVMRISVNGYGAVCSECQRKRKVIREKGHWRKYVSTHGDHRVKYMADRQKQFKGKAEQERLDSLKVEIFDLHTFQKWDVNKIAKFNMDDYIARARV